MASSAVSTVLDLNIDLIIVSSETGTIARLVSKYKPAVPVLACSAINSVIRNLQVVRGVWGYKLSGENKDKPGFDIISRVIKVAKENHLVKSGAKVVVIQVE